MRRQPTTTTRSSSMLYFYCPKPTDGVFELIKSLGAIRLRHFDGMDFWNKNKRFNLTPNDVIVCWGGTIPELDGPRVLNAYNGDLTKPDVSKILSRLDISTVLHYPLNKRYETVNYLVPRELKAIAASDLLKRTKNPDYYVKLETLRNEYRIHSFAGKSIRAGSKGPMAGYRPVDTAEWLPESNMVHPWVRNSVGGWRINYEGFQSTARLRKLAHLVIKTLGLTFGAVDIGEHEEGHLMIIDVALAPDLDSGSVPAYIRAINKWVDGKFEEPEDGNEPKGAKREPFRVGDL